MAVATGFAQLWRGIGQVVGVAVPSAIFQSLLDRELSKRITGPGSEDVSTQLLIISTLRLDTDIVLDYSSNSAFFSVGHFSASRIAEAGSCIVRHCAA